MSSLRLVHLDEMADALHEAARLAAENFGKSKDVTRHLRKAEQEVRWAQGSLKTELLCREIGKPGPLSG